MVTDVKELSQWIEQSLVEMAQLTHQLERLYHSVAERLYPLIEQLKPIWTDPLWQFIGLIFLSVLLLFILYWLGRSVFRSLVKLIRWGKNLIQKSASTLKKVITWIADLFIKKITAQKVAKKPSQQTVLMSQFRRAVNAIQYLITKREWRYQMRWSLLIGEPNSGKTQLIQSIEQGERAQLLPQEKRLKTAASGWYFFDHGVVIESSDHNLKENLEQFCWYRPERPLDQIILCISAKSLLQTEPPSNLEELGEKLFQQLWQVQKQTGFVLPVYVLVTQCDQVMGFSAFWQAQPPAVREQIVGWSNPNRLQTVFSENWVNEAFQTLLESLQSAQLHTASGEQEIANIDEFMLFLQAFSALESPLHKVMQATFTHSSLQEPFPLRGIYFTGELANKTAFIEDVFQQKIFVEKHLASMVEKRRFSSNRILRRLQVGGVVGGVLMLVLLLVDISRLSQINHYNQETLQQLTRIPLDCSAQGEDTYQLLQGLSNVAQQSRVALSMPLSWFELTGKQEQRLIASHILESNLLPALACRLQQRADSLTLSRQEPQHREKYRALMQQLNDYQTALIAFETAQQTYIQLAGPKENGQGTGKALSHLLTYLYDNPIPDDIQLNQTLIDGALEYTHYQGHKISQQQPLISKTKSLHYIEQLTEQVQHALLQHAQQIPLGPLQAFNHQTTVIDQDRALPKPNLLTDYHHLKQWLQETQHDWLASSATNSPCGVLQQQQQSVKQSLLSFGYDANRLEHNVQRFAQATCDQQIRQGLSNLVHPPLGELFHFDDKGLLSQSQQSKTVLTKLHAITELYFIKSDYMPVIDSSEHIVQWREAPLQQLVETLIQYQQFNTLYGAIHTFNNSLEKRLQQVSQRLLSQAMIRPAQRIRAPRPINDIIAHHERALSEAVDSFKQVQELLLQIETLLRQQGDMANALWLNQQIHHFVIQQLQTLDQLVQEYHLYQPVQRPQWQKAHFAQALFNLSDDKQTQIYLTNQQQKLSYFAFNYAQVLLQYLQNSGAGLSDAKVRRWLATLQDLGRYERGEPNNQVSLLNDLLSKQLIKLSNASCSQHNAFAVSHPSDSWLAQRREQLEQHINLHCSQAEKKALIERYQHIANAFNENLAGRYPFATSQKAGHKDLKNKALQRFLSTYRQQTKGLLSALKTQQQKDGSIPNSWLEFIEQMNLISEFFQHTWQAKAKTWQVNLAVHFDSQGALSARNLIRDKHTKGSNQIIEWRLQSGADLALFPNGNGDISWSPDKAMQLSLRWATGSPYLPIHRPGTQSNPLHAGSPQSLIAQFASKSRWGLFEWLEQYGTEADERASDEHLLSFYVPVGLKGQPPYTDEPAYISRSNILLQAQVSDAKGEVQALALPRHFPTYAP